MGWTTRQRRWQATLRRLNERGWYGRRRVRRPFSISLRAAADAGSAVRTESPRVTAQRIYNGVDNGAMPTE